MDDSTSKAPTTAPRVSVVMPVYNAGRFLSAALESVLAQTFADFELIAVDDGSTDTSAMLLEGCGDRRLRVVRLPHCGLIGALNHGLGLCRGEYLARMDADDICHKERFARQVELLERRPDIAVVATAADEIDDDGRRVGVHPPFDADDMELALAAGNPIVHGSVMLRRSAMPPPPVYRLMPEDYRLWVDLLERGASFACLPERLYQFRKHGASFSITAAVEQSRAALQVQWPLLERCHARSDRHQLAVRDKLIRGWGRAAGFAYRIGDADRVLQARHRLEELLEGPWPVALEDAIENAYVWMRWGGAPTGTLLAYRLRQLWRRPWRLASYRHLAGALPLVRRWRQPTKRDRGNRAEDG